MPYSTRNNYLQRKLQVSKIAIVTVVSLHYDEVTRINTGVHVRSVRLLPCLVFVCLFLVVLPLSCQSTPGETFDPSTSQVSLKIDTNFIQACHTETTLSSSAPDAEATLFRLAGSLPQAGLNLHGILSLSTTDHLLSNGFSVNIGRQRTHFFAGSTVLRDSYSRSIVFPAQIAALVRDNPNDTEVTWAANSIRVVLRGDTALHRRSQLFQLSISAQQDHIDSVAICYRPERRSGNYEIGQLFFSTYISTENGPTPLSVELFRGSEPPITLKLAE